MYCVSASPFGTSLQCETVIRPYRAEDNPVLSEIWHAASCLSHHFLPDELLAAQKKLVSEKYLPETETWVAVSGETPVGFIGLIDSFIGGLFVSPDCQGGGIGSALLDHAFRLKGHLLLEVYAANHRALAFYRRHGFCGIKRRETDDNGLPFPLIMMQKPVPATRRQPEQNAQNDATSP
ncbi:GNAT family N-acetyltransferase [Martelella soudanensis]|uniref:GNAT family N-acetyltransferase n=1 Tax=unclassified Martelella TaxID=2629616 RepID=UPI0015DE7342|nr:MULTISPECIES: GNAT family N-acetyltransferase [unclassified Martelella]